MEDLTLAQLLNLLKMDTTDQDTKESVIKIILENFNEKPLVRYNRSLTHLEREISSKMLQNEAQTARLCALNIIEEFGDFNPINNISQLELIITTQIENAKEYPIKN